MILQSNTIASYKIRICVSIKPHFRGFVNYAENSTDVRGNSQNLLNEFHCDKQNILRIVFDQLFELPLRNV